MLETLVFYVGYDMLFFIILLICSLKFNFESIVIPSSITDETDFAFISPICNVYERILPRITNQDLLSLNCIENNHIRFTYLV